MREPARRHEVKIAPAPLPSNPQVRVLLEDFGPDASESNGAITVLDLQNTDSEMKAFIGGIALGRYGYYCPYVHNKMAKVDLSDFSTVTTISLDSRGYSAIIADPARGALYLVRSYFTYSTERPTAIPCIGCSRSATKPPFHGILITVTQARPTGVGVVRTKSVILSCRNPSDGRRPWGGEAAARGQYLGGGARELIHVERFPASHRGGWHGGRRGRGRADDALDVYRRPRGLGMGGGRARCSRGSAWTSCARSSCDDLPAPPAAEWVRRRRRRRRRGDGADGDGDGEQ